MTFAVKKIKDLCTGVPQCRLRLENMENFVICFVPIVLHVSVDHLNGLIIEQYFALYFTSINRTTLD